MQKRKKKYSKFIRPLIVLLDVVLINSIIYYYSDKEYINIAFLSYIGVSWLLIAFYTKFYNVYRYTHVLKLLSLMSSQFLIFFLSFFTYFSVFREGVIINSQFNIVITILIVISGFKFLSFFLLKSYRIAGNNYRNVIIFGENSSSKNIVKLFNKRPDLGYRYWGFFTDNKSNSDKYLGVFDDGFEYILRNNIDEIYCKVSSVTEKQLNRIRTFTNENKKELRLIPESKSIYSKDFILEYYGTIPVLKPKQLPFERVETHFLKRTFDILFSSIVCIVILSWLFPILFVLVKLDSKGPFFFKQRRDGIDGAQFFCYKIRSMRINVEKKQASKNNKRITKIGSVLRRTSLDELPQFFNVLKGEMSVVGPRPHINIQTEKYLKEIDNYITRNSVKPGITGLAQVSGYRGEVLMKSDIKNRVKLDVFYIENWSFFLDMKIILLTIFNVFKGDEKAY